MSFAVACVRTVSRQQFGHRWSVRASGLRQYFCHTRFLHNRHGKRRRVSRQRDRDRWPTLRCICHSARVASHSRVPERATSAREIRLAGTEAAQYVVPLTTSNAEDINNLRVSASQRYLSTSHEGLYKWTPAEKHEPTVPATAGADSGVTRTRRATNVGGQD
jgi:hypothetical protein